MATTKTQSKPKEMTVPTGMLHRLVRERALLRCAVIKLLRERRQERIVLSKTEIDVLESEEITLRDEEMASTLSVQLRHSQSVENEKTERKITGFHNKRVV